METLDFIVEPLDGILARHATLTSNLGDRDKSLLPLHLIGYQVDNAILHNHYGRASLDCCLL